MGIKIKSINIESLGPIKSSISLDLGIFNLIFGRNEMGKTFMVEFIIKSLFSNINNWKFRSDKGTGKITIEGIEDKLIERSPAPGKKLDDYIDMKYPGLPPNLSKLMIVKGAELDFENSDCGISEIIIKNYLSNKGVFQEIRERISKTIQGANIDNWIIGGASKGEISYRKEIFNKIEEIGNLFDEINKNYSSGSLKKLEEEKKELENKRNALIYAKQNLAFKKSEEINLLIEQSNRIDNNILAETDKMFANYKIQAKKYEVKKVDQEKNEEKIRHYEWLKNAYEIYEKQTTPKSWLVMLINCLVFISFISIISFSILNILWGVIISIIFCAGIFLFNFFYQKIILNDSNLEKEKKLIKDDFKVKFNTELKNIAQLKTLKDSLSRYDNNNSILKDQLKSDLNDLNTMEINIDMNFNKLGIKDISKEKWDIEIKGQQDLKKRLEDKIRFLEKELASLNIDPSDYKKIDKNFKYSKVESESVESELDTNKENITINSKKLEILKQKICGTTKNNINESWERIISTLKKQQDEFTKEYKNITAEIVGKISVCKVLEELENEEDKKISDALDSDYIKKPLFDLTRRYKGIYIESGIIKVKDDFNDFNLSDLSTGAREQILLALRIGFITRLLKTDNNLLILDDAFQYSDWERRSFLLGKMVELAERDCQIIYFTMDNHIRDIFNKEGEKFGKEYKYYELK